MKWAILVHGGAGEWSASDEEAVLAGMELAVEGAAEQLAAGASALDAAVAAAVVLEDDPLFNAGTGSALNADGEAEMDAAVMTGHDSRDG
jgi:beta-aspartyl-peptidase (threonine type)